jgi:glycosyltransferase involved in cell wall biosynthesis
MRFRGGVGGYALTSYRLKGLARLADRELKELPANTVRECVVFAATNYLRRQFSQERAGADLWARQNRAFGRAVSRKSWNGANVIYAFNGCALEVFSLARRRGLCCVLDQTAAPWRYNSALLRKEQREWPGWEENPADLDRSGQMIAREEAEWQLADRIVCGSQFVVDSIGNVGGPVEKCVVVSYPIPDCDVVIGRRSNRGSIRVLFVGTLQLRKGIQYFWEAARRLNGLGFEFRAVGPSSLTSRAESQLQQYVTWIGPVRRTQVWEHFAWADAFLLPTLSEGSSNACLEALASGVPVLTSAAAGLREWESVTAFRGADEIASRLHPRLKLFCYTSRPSGTAVRSVAEYGRDLVRAIEAAQ